MIASDHLHSVVRLFRRAGRFWWVGVTLIALGVAATLAAAKFRPKQYRSEAVVYYQEGMQWTTTEGVGARRIGQRLKDMLLARAQLAKLIEAFGLYPKLVQAGRTAEAIEEMRLATGFRVAEGDVFVISFTGESAAQAQRVTARLTDVLIAENARLRSSQAEVAREFLDAEKKRNEAALAAKEAEQLRFLAKHPEFAHEPTTIGAALRATTKKGPEASAARGGLAALRREEERLRRQLATPGQVPAAPVDPALVAAKNQAEAALHAAQRELADRRARFTEQHPDVRTAVAMVREATEAYRRAAAAAEVTEASVAPAELEARLAQVRKDIADYRREHPEEQAAPEESAARSQAAARVVALEAEWARLTREVAEARERLQELDARQFLASMTASTVVSGQAAQIVVIDPAFLPAQPIGMSRTRLLLMGLVMSLALGTGGAVLAGLLDDRAFDHGDVERLELAPVLIEVPREALATAEGGGGPEAPGGETGDALAEVVAPPWRTRPEPQPASLEKGPALLEAPSDVAAGANPGPDPGFALVGVSGSQPIEARSGPREDGGSARQATAAVQLAQAANAGAPLIVVDAAGRDSYGPGDAFPNVVQVQRMKRSRKVGASLFMLAAPDSQAAASFRVLRHRLGSAQGPKTILVTSPRAGEGKTLCAVNLALALGEDGRARVLLLEANYRSPALARVLDFLPPVCISAQLELRHERPGQPWVVVEAVTPWLHTMAVAPDAGARPLLDGPGLDACIRDLRSAGYDHIVIDGPPILGSADVNLLEEKVDGILVTMRAGKSHVRELRGAVEQVGRGKMLGVALLGT